MSLITLKNYNRRSYAINIFPIPAFSDNYIWAIVAEHKALVVDPGEAAPVIKYLEQQQLNLVGILITHHHWDHTNGVAELVQRFHAPVYGGKLSQTAGISWHGADGDKVVINQTEFTLLDIPAHTLDHVAFFAPGILFCGDTLFAAGCGRVFEGNAEMMYTSLQKLAALPDATKVYCGHEYTEKNLRFAEMVEPQNVAIQERLKEVIALRKKNLPSLPSTIHIEKETNPFLRCDVAEVVANVEQFAGKKLTNVVEVFYWLRKWKDGF